MDKSESTEEEKHLSLHEESGSDDEWDDSLLIKEYDRAVAKARCQILKKLQLEMGLSNRDIQEVFSDASSQKKRNKKDKRKKSKLKWTVGSACRATYFEDGEEYEAEIVEFVEPDSCIVSFIGYENQEEVLVSDLKPSSGNYKRNLQIMAANGGRAVKEEISKEESNDCTNSQNPQFMYQGCNWDKIDPRFFNTLKREPMGPLGLSSPPPPPPPPTMGISKQPMEDEAMNSMLMSWYMCGYYTGYYQRAMQNN